ncbi:hypothetical protein LTR35_009000 [Friedmanniomyces endolithicus]|uniref:Carboxypeptidase n=1 Tax=Friedmanniomyces endolithicus TaxID=329885 RepID=A0AAN6JEH1_9PEZI|nr:hypothetical protein LTR35_009000 [Friedmanniomyces endolithicus]KAK0295432.1 hypothetical protein LTS00_006063 [Friedmanniomyces endolithicus]KAK0327162.1 hypothetical protein LTR82_001924 [Friedmanniomyces endolithicus]
MHWLSLGAVGLSVASSAVAQGGFPPPLARDIKTVPVAGSDASISYRETSICEEHAKAWAGYVRMTSTYIQDVQGDDPYNTSYFFWYFEASMNTHVNMLYVDQPNSVGFSYDAVLNSTFDTLFLVPEVLNDTGIVSFDEYPEGVPEASSTLWYGSFPSQNILHTANTTAIAARTLWHFAQGFFGSFPEYKTCNKDISLWGNSYGGYTVPVTAAYFVSQNEKIQNEKLNGSAAVELPVDTIGFTNGCTDLLYQLEYYPQMAYNNTHGLQVINETVYEMAMAAVPACLQLVRDCRSLSEEYVPDEFAFNETVNAVCTNATATCAAIGAAYDMVSNRSDFDMAHMKPDPFPPYYLAGYLNQDWVQKELGVPVNYTEDSNLVANIFLALTGDPSVVRGLEKLEYLLSSGVKVALVYGDRDYRCPWLGGEALSLQANWTGAGDFRAAGYEYIHTNPSYSGGVVRQHGNLSFSRVFESGHDAKEPETNFQIFNRALFNKDIASGRLPTSGRFNKYSTTGPSSSFSIKDVLPRVPDPICYVYTVGSACTVDQYVAFEKGNATVVEFVVTDPNGGGGPILGSAV